MNAAEEDPRERLTAPWRIGVDVGGTFTDLVIVGRAGELHLAKVPSTPADPSVGVLRAVEHAAGRLGLSTPALLGGCSHFMHASTVATNVVLEGRGSRVGMLVTSGFRDSLAIRRGIRPNAWDHRRPFPPVLVPRYLRLPVRGRIDRRGEVIEPLRPEDVREAARIFAGEGVESVAICLFNSFLDSRHEAEAAEILRSELKDLWITSSSDIAPVMGEYERSSTAVLNAYVAPRIVSYVTKLRDELVSRGLTGAFYMVQNNGGAVSVDGVAKRPVTLLLSGPAAGAGALALYGKALGDPGLLSVEIGGTSCDLMLISGGRAETATEFEIGGYHAALASIDIHTIGAGGGTVAAVDRGGLLQVGPRGAGADPGPAAYGRGGLEPTVTDAQLLLGRLKPGPLAEGRSLDLELAREAIRTRIAEPLGLTLEAAAAGILKLVEQQIFHAVQKITAERGHDPRNLILVAAGGAGPMHACSVARDLQCRAIYVPRLAGAFCALGTLNIPIRHDYGRALVRALGPCLSSTVGPSFDAFEADARAQLAYDGFDDDRIEVVRELALHHPGQVGSIRIGIAPGPEIDIGAVRRDFLAAYEQRYGHRDEAATIEVGGVRLSGLGSVGALVLRAPPSGAPEAVPKGVREVYFEATGGWTSTAVYDGASLGPGASLAGPAVIEEATTSIVIEPGHSCTVDPLGNFLIRRNGEEAELA